VSMQDSPLFWRSLLAVIRDPTHTMASQVGIGWITASLIDLTQDRPNRANRNH
jgi:hypothetical protein